MPVNYKLYPANWKSWIVPTVLARAKNKCEECGVTNGSIVYSIPIKYKRKGKTVYRKLWLWADPYLIAKKIKEVRVILTVAHLDHDRGNHSVKLDRLKALCQRCHLILDSQVKAQRRKCHPFCQYPNCSQHDILPWCVR